MGERYLYDIKTESWQQAVPVEKTAPAVLVINVLWGAGKQERLVWCPKHSIFEKIHHLERRDSIRSVTGCQMQGMAAVLFADRRQAAAEKMESKYYVPFCWQTNLLENGGVLVEAQVLAVILTFHHSECRITLGDSHIQSGRRTLRESFHIGETAGKIRVKSKDWPDYGLDIPAVVTDSAMAYLLKGAEGHAYMPPDSMVSGYRKLRAFIIRPHDLHIEYWRDVLREEFEQIFPRECKNPFLQLCRYLGLEPTASLVSGYEKNPFAPLWALLLRQWGFKEESSWEYFYGLSTFAGLSPADFSLEKTNWGTIYIEFRFTSDYIAGMDEKSPAAQKYAEESIWEKRLKDLMDYTYWALRQIPEGKVAKYGLFYLASRPWTEEIKEELEMAQVLLPTEYLTKEEQQLSPIARHHLLGFNQHWHGGHWQAEHELTMQELNAIRALRWEHFDQKMAEEEAEEEQEVEEVTGTDVVEESSREGMMRIGRIIGAYDKMLHGRTVFAKDYPQPSMLGRDMSLLRQFEPAVVYASSKGGYELLQKMPRYEETSEILPLMHDSRKLRLMAYTRFLYDCGFLNRDYAEKLVGKPVPRRTFVRDLGILRQACPDKKLVYRAKEKCYVWEVEQGGTP